MFLKASETLIYGCVNGALIMGLDDREAGRRERIDSSTRRAALQTIGAGIGIGALGLTAPPVAAHHNGEEWNEGWWVYGEYEGSNAWHGKKVDAELKYQGYDDEGDLISHHFAFALASNTFDGRKSYSWAGVEPENPDPFQDGSRFLIDNVPGGTENMNIDRTYPAYVDHSTDQTWYDVIQGSSDSLDEYRDEARQEVYQDTSDSTFSELVAFVGKKALNEITGGLSDAVQLAAIIFGSDGNDVCGVNKIEGDPSGFEWDFCTGYVPLQWHHGKVEIKVPDDGTSHRVTLSQEAFIWQDNYDNPENSIRWNLDLPGYRSSASMASVEAYHRDF